MHYSRARDFVRKFARQVMHGESPTGILGMSASRMGQGLVFGPAKEFCVAIYVERLLTSDELSQRGLNSARQACVDIAIREGITLAAEDIEIIPVGDRFRSQAYFGSSHANPPAVNTQKWFKSLMPGIGIANPSRSYPYSFPHRLEAGTAGFFMRDQKGHIYLVSCNHVIALERKTGDAVSPETIVQPATRDLTGSDLSRLQTLADLEQAFGVAELSYFVPIDLHGAAQPYPSNQVDVALARLLEADRDRDDLNRLPYGGCILDFADPFALDPIDDTIIGPRRVFKIGRTTGYTEGYVSGLDGVMDVDFAGGRATFDDQIIVRVTVDNTGTFSEGGDSGSALITDGHKIAGLIFAGTPERSLANPMDIVRAELGKLVAGLQLV